MAFPETHLYVTTHWTLTGTEEEGQVGIRFSRNTALSQAECDAVAQSWATFWALASAEIPTQHVLYKIKAALIGTNGQYPVGHSPTETLLDPVVGGGGGSSLYPAQVAHVMTLRSAVPRGYASRGRIYLPPIADTLDAERKWLDAPVLARTQAFAALLGDLQTDIGSPASIYSSVGAGIGRVVMSVAGGDRPDVQRRRARAIPETYQEVAL